MSLLKYGCSFSKSSDPSFEVRQAKTLKCRDKNLNPNLATVCGLGSCSAVKISISACQICLLQNIVVHTRTAYEDHFFPGFFSFSVKLGYDAEVYHHEINVN